MAKKRIYDLDSQSSYAGKLFVEVDAPATDNWQASKKIDLETLAPKIQKESSVTNSTVNTATFLMRLNNGSGAEYRKTLDDFFSLFTEDYQSSNLYNSSGDVKGKLFLQRIKNTVVGIFTLQDDTGSSSEFLYTDTGGASEDLLVLPSGFRPAYAVKCDQNSLGNENIGNYVIIQTDGNVKARTDRTDVEAISISYVAF